MEKIVANRLLSISKFILAIFSFAALAFLHDLNFSKLELEMNLADEMQEIQENFNENGPDFRPVISKNSREWLQVTQHDLWDKNRIARAKLRGYLAQAGIPDSVINALRASDGDRFNLIGLVNSSEYRRYNDAKKSISFDSALTKYEYFANENSLRVVVDIRPDSLYINKLRSFIKSTYLRKSKEVDVNGISLDYNSNIIIDFNTSNELQSFTSHKSFKINSNSIVIKGAPSLLVLSKPKPVFKSMNQNLKLKSVIEKLRKKYRGISYKQAQVLIAQEYANEFETLDVFGFKFHSQQIPWIILIGMLSAVAGIFFTVTNAITQRIAAITAVKDEDLLLIENFWIRMILWSLLPTMAIVFSWHHIAVKSLSGGAFVLASIVVAITGLAASYRSRLL